MLDIKKKIIAIMTICAMALSMSACSDDGEDKDTKTANDIKVATLTPEEASEMVLDKFEIVEFTEGDVAELGQDPQESVEQDPVEQDPQESQGESPIVDENGSIVDNVDLQISAVDSNIGGDSNSDGGNGSEGGNNAAQGDVNSDENNNSADSNEGGNSAVVESTGTKKIQQAFWMNLNGDFNFEGEFITATFKIKETTADGTYPITLEWLDFANIKGVSLDDVSGIDGAVVVGGTAEQKEFTDGFQVKADCVSGNPGDEVTVTFQMKNNPGICACVFRFGYDSDALEYVGGSKGADFVNALTTQNVN